LNRVVQRQKTDRLIGATGQQGGVLVDSWQATEQVRDAGSSEFPVPFVEWQRKPITFVGYGALGAARAIETLRPQSGIC
jgi:hypothetical protein